MASTSFPDLMTMLIGIGKVIPSIIMLMQLVAMVTGTFITISGLIEVWGAGSENSAKYLSSQRSYSTAVGITQIVLGGVLLATGTLEFVGILSRTVTGDYAAARMTADVLSYNPGQDSNTAEKAKAVTMALLALMQAVGFAAIYKGWLSLNRYVKQGSSSVSFGTCMTWIIGGIFAWNFKWVSDVVNNTVGFNFLSLFSSLK